MTSLFENVVGCILNIQNIHSAIPFSSPSDTLFGSLFVKYRNSVPIELFNDLLALLRHADFHSDEVTIQKAEDILDHIANQRRMISRDRNQRRKQDEGTAQSVLAHYESRPAGLILELVAEYIDSQRLPFHQTLEVNRWSGAPLCEMNDVLVTMSLVHRTWTDVAQRFLRRRILVSQALMQAVLQSPRIGPWVRELCFRGFDNMAFESTTYTRQASRLLSRILERCPNITHLYLEGFESMDPDAVSPGDRSRELDGDVVARIAKLEHLEYLWLRHRYVTQPNNQISKRVCTIVPHLRRLKSLSIKRWEARANPFEIIEEDDHPGPTYTLDLTKAISPPGSLESLSLVQFDFLTSGLLAWLMKPGNGTHIKRLELCACDIFVSGGQPVTHPDLAILSRFLDTGVARVSALQLVVCRDYRSLGFILRLFPSLRSLRLCAENVFPTAPISLPDSVQEFYLHLDNHTLPDDEQDAYVCDMLKACPNVRRLTITYATNCPLQAHFKNATDYSLTNEVQFKVERVDILPNFLDLLITKAM